MDPREDALLEQAIHRILAVARALGLDPAPLRFEIVPARVIHELSAYGLPGRFSHWSHGKAFQRIKMGYDLGLIRVYELVINTDPCHAFLLETNSLLENQLVAAHVVAHSDFFRHNVHFRRAGAGRMAERARLHAERIREYEYRYGTARVEEVLDAALALEGHVDPWLGEDGEPAPPEGAAGASPDRGNPRPGGEAPAQDPFGEPMSDLLLFLLRHSPVLEEWERDVLAMVRAERLYFVPQLRTKILNEGWATFWHARIMRELDLDDAGFTEFARLHAQVRAPGGLHPNPYLLGSAVLERLWLESGRDDRLLFEIRECEDDVSFLRNYLTPELVRELDLFLYAYRDGAWVVADDDPEAVIRALIEERVRGGVPLIVVADPDYGGRRELYLRHVYDGRALHVEDACKTLDRVARLWGRPVHLETVVGGRTTVLSSGAPGPGVA